MQWSYAEGGCSRRQSMMLFGVSVFRMGSIRRRFAMPHFACNFCHGMTGLDRSPANGDRERENGSK